jgi:hypothetical protein
MPAINIPFLIKGALVYFDAPMLSPDPKTIVFQYNPDSLSRSFTPWAAPPRTVVAERDVNSDQIKRAEPLQAHGETLARLSQPYDPAETFSLTLELDAADLLDFADPNATAAEVGVADRLAAIEMLLYPVDVDASAGGMQPSQGSTLAQDSSTQPKNADPQSRADLHTRDAPIVLFYWGPGRILPVRIQSLTIEEQQYSATLYPTRAKATIGLRVVDLDDLSQLSADPAMNGATQQAKACYSYTLSRKRKLADQSVSGSRPPAILGTIPN